MRDLFPCHGAGGPSRIHPLLTGLLFCWALGTASAASAATTLDWGSTFPWSPGDLTHTYSFGPPESVDVTITVSTTAAGSFTTYNGTATAPPCTVDTPGKDGSGQLTDFFGGALDLGVIFDPASGVAGSAPVLINIKFTNLGSGAAGPLKPVSSLKFEISDIDTSSAGVYPGACSTGAQGNRRDKVVVTADNSGSPVTGFSFTVKPGVATPTFTLSGGNTATGITGSSSNNDSNGTAVVNFGALFVTNVLLTYSEDAFNAATNQDPGYRGIGIFGLTTFPVELMELTVE